MITHQDWRIAVVIPSYRVKKHILDVIQRIGSEVTVIYVIDDKCPEGTGEYVLAQCKDPRVVVRFNNENLGVGGAVMAGYRAALEDGSNLIIKIDGDGQMDPDLIPTFIEPIISGHADYTKGNRFFNLNHVRAMPTIRLFGNAALSFLNKLSSGYWDIFDPTNGYTAIHADVLRQLPLDKISERYFFESDMLFRLNLQRAVVIDVSMDAKYGDEVSNLKISSVAGEFLFKHLRNLVKRVFYNYYLRDMSLASIELPVGIILFLFGTIFGLFQWASSAAINAPTPAGTVMLAALPTLMGLQLILAFLSFDINSVPRVSSRKNTPPQRLT